MRRAYAPWLAAIVAASFAFRMVVGWLRAAPALFPDEYTYAAIGRSIASSGRPLIRGTSPHFPALLEPIVMAPAWLVGDVGLAYRLVQTIGALAMSLAAVPVFLLARRLRLSGRLSLALAAFTVLVPDLVYASFVSSEAIAYPLLLTAVYTAVRALSQPTRRTQAAFVAAAGLAALARIQFAMLPFLFLLAAVAIGLRERRLKAALREQLLTFGLFALPLLAVVAAGPGRVLGTYRAVLGFHGGIGGIVHWAGLDAMTLAYAAGWIVVPGALLGLWLAVAKPRSRDELAFGVFTVLMTVALLVQAGLLQASLPLGKEIQERYVFYAVPLLGLAFALYASRGWPLPVHHLALAAALVVVSVRFPLSQYAVPATVDGSPILYAVYWLTGKVGEAGMAAVVVAAVVGVLSVVSVLGSRRPRLGTPVALGLALLATGAASAGAVAFDVTNTGIVKKAFLPSDPSWVDRAGVHNATLVQAWGGIRAASLQELFWNRSIEKVVLLPGANSIDRFGEERLTIEPDGSMTAGGRPLSGPLVMDSYGSTVKLQGAHLVEAGPTASLWVPDGRPRLQMYAIGRYYDGWLADAGAIYIWPASKAKPVSGWLSMRLTAPADVPTARITFQLPGGERTVVVIPPGATRRLHVAVCGDGGDWYTTYKSNIRGLFGLRSVSVKATEPVFTPSAAACPVAQPVAY